MRRLETNLGVSPARRPPHAVYVLLGFIWRVKLNDPVDRRDIQPTRRDVGAQQNPLVGVAELEEGGGAFLKKQNHT